MGMKMVCVVVEDSIAAEIELGNYALAAILLKKGAKVEVSQADLSAVLEGDPDTTTAIDSVVYESAKEFFTRTCFTSGLREVAAQTDTSIRTRQKVWSLLVMTLSATKEQQQRLMLLQKTGSLDADGRAWLEMSPEMVELLDDLLHEMEVEGTLTKFLIDKGA